MEKEFIPYELAVDLKELGFDEPCLINYYIEKGEMYIEHTENGITNTKLDETTDELNEEQRENGEFLFEYSYAAPTWHQAFKWIRDNFYLVCIVFNDDGDIEHENLRYNWEIRVVTRSFKDLKNQRNARLGEYTYRSYEEAELDCLKQMLKLLKTRKHE